MARQNNGKKVGKLTVGCLNVRGCGADEKKCMTVDMFKERKMKLRGKRTRMGG